MEILPSRHLSPISENLSPRRPERLPRPLTRSNATELVGSTKLLRYHGPTPPVQLDLPFFRVPAGESRGGLTVEFVRTRRARRYIVRVRHDGSIRVTIPRGGSRAEGARFLERQSAWIATQRARVLAAHVTPS